MKQNLRKLLMNRVTFWPKKSFFLNVLLVESFKKVVMTVRYLLCAQQHAARQRSWTYFRRTWSISKLSCERRVITSEIITNPATKLIRIVDQFDIGFKRSEIVSKFNGSLVRIGNQLILMMTCTERRLLYELWRRGAQHLMTTYALTNKNAC